MVRSVRDAKVYLRRRQFSPKAAMAAPGNAGVTEQAVAPAVRSSCRILQQTYETEKRNRISGLNLFHISRFLV
jgi:hypothetical protein